MVGEERESEGAKTPSLKKVEELEAAVPGGFARPKLNIEKKSVEVTRLLLAVGLTTGYLGAIVAILSSFLLTNDQVTPSDVKDLSVALLAPLGTLVASVVGFYFATKNN